MALLGIVQQSDLIVARIDGVQLSHGLVRALLASDPPAPLSSPIPAEKLPVFPEV